MAADDLHRGWWSAVDDMLMTINTLDTEGMDAAHARSAIYKALLDLRPRKLWEDPKPAA
jgi:hypothetical protein